MATLEDKTLKSTYRSLLKVSDNGELDATEQEITDGAGNSTGVSLNTSGDITATGAVSFGSLKDVSDLTITKFVDEADGIANNDNDSSVPTSAAVRDYVDNNITSQDLDISDGTNNGSVDLDSQSLIFTGDAGVSATVSGQTLTLDSSALQSQIDSNDSDITALQAADVTLQNNIDAEASTRSSADTTLQGNIDTEEAARIAADSTLQGNISSEASTRLNADDALQANIDAEESARIAADDALDNLITVEETARITADNTLQSNIDAEAIIRAAEDSSLQAAISTETTDRISADAALQSSLDDEIAARLAEHNAIQDSIDAEAVARAAEDTNLHAEIDTEISDRAAADVTLQANIDAEAATRLANDNTLQANIDAEATARANADTALQALITSNDGDIAALDTRLTTAEGNITSNDSDISGLDARLTTAEGNITSNDSDISGLDSRLTTAESNITSNDSDISGLDTRLTTAEGDITNLGTSKQSVSEKGQANGYASLDSNGTVPTSQLPESVTGALIFEGLWDASTNTPTLPDPTLHKGDYYKVSVEGVYLGETFHVGDWAVSDGIAWQHIHTQETVSDVFGRTGSITAQEGDYSAFYPLLSDLAATDANVLANTTKLAGIEAGADVTDATNVAAAGALMSGTAALNDLADVSVSGVIDGQLLAYNATSGNWEAGSAAAAPVDSVNGQIGVVVLDADDIDDSATTNKFTTAADISKLAGIEAGADVTDTTNVVAALTAGTNITIAANGTISSTDTNTTYTAGGGLTLAGTEFSHSDTSSAATLAASGRRYVTGLTFDTYGHVTGYTTGTETVVDTNTTYSAGSGLSLSGTTFSHSDTSAQASVNNSDGTVIQDVTVDGYGHITGLASVNLDGRYYTEAEVNSLLAGKLGTTAKAADSNLLDGIDSSGFIRTTYNSSLNSDSRNSRGVTRLYRREDNSDYSVQTQWNGSHWVLEGYGGDTYHAGCRVAYADSAGSASTATTASQVTINYNNDASSTYQMLWGSGNTVYGTAGVVVNPNTDAITSTTHYCSNWFRSTGATGWYSETYGGGINMQDTTWVRVYGSKAFYVANQIAATGDVTAYYSDMRLKEKTGDIENPVEKVKQLSGFYYVENEKAKELGYNNDKTQIGVSAQEVQAVIPEAVKRAPIDIETLEDGTQVSKSGEEYLTVQYERLVPLLIEAIKEQQTQIDELKARLDGITN